MKYELVALLGIELACAWVWVQTLGDQRKLHFCHFWFWFEVQGL